MPKLLAVDDEPNILHSIEKNFRSDSLEVLLARSGREGLDLVRLQRPDAVIVDVRLGDVSGLEVFDQIRTLDPRLPVILITAHGETETAIEAMKRGAFEYLLKPVDVHQLREVVNRALELSRFRHVPPILDQADGSVETVRERPSAEAAAEADRIVGRSPGMQEVYKAIGRVAPRDVTVLITGESGTGKELVARAVYHHSPRAGGPFQIINCAAIPEGLLESELFGHERGAFTGAERRRVGKFEQAHTGTLFLDEIGDMSVATQAKVLRLLQQQRFERLGGNEAIQVDVRLIAATNKDLEAEVRAGRFRMDLFYRLNDYTIHLPPLRERREDLPLLIDHFVRVLNRTLKRTVHSLTPEAMRCLESYEWQGNVRELQSVLKYALIQSTGDVITLDCLPENLRSATGTPAQAPGLGGGMAALAEFTESLLRAGEPDIYRQVCQEMDRVVLETVLRHVGGNQVKASELLGISRTTLRAKLRALRQGSEGRLPDPEQPE
jgi:two-component system nitrogen regulation response regulator GlnG